MPPGGNLIDIGLVFEVSAVYSDTGQPATLLQPYTLTVQYTNADKGPATEVTLALYSWNGDQWLQEPTSDVDVVANTVTATPDHLGLWAVFGETRRVFCPLVLKGC